MFTKIDQAFARRGYYAAALLIACSCGCLAGVFSTLPLLGFDSASSINNMSFPSCWQREWSLIQGVAHRVVRGSSPGQAIATVAACLQAVVVVSLLCLGCDRKK